VEPPVPTPVVDLLDRSIYTQNLKPGFYDEIDRAGDAPHYFIQALLVPGETPLVTGIQRVRYVNRQSVPLESVYFRLYPNLPAYGGRMTISQIIADNQFVTPILEAQESALRVDLPATLAPGEAADITLWFVSELPTFVQAGTAGSGLYGYFQNVYDLAGFYPTLAVYNHEGWQLGITPTFGDSTFTESAFYQVQLTLTQDLEMVASGSTVQRRDNEDGTHTWRVIAGPVRAFYAAASSQYDYFTQDVDGTAVNSYYLINGLTGAQTAMSYTTRSLQVFNQMFGEYPYLELDVIPMPTTGFGMEYPGVIAIASSFYGPGGGAFAIAVVHEVAHQWWYNLVGNDQPGEPWVDESLSNYAVYLYYEAIEWREMQDSVMNNIFLYRYNAARNLGIDRPVAGPVSSFDASNYVNMIYSKGALFFHALRQAMGDDAFFAGLKEYAQIYRHDIAYGDDLLAAFQSHTEAPLDEIYRFWITGE
jgi:hypothetical protein